MGFMTLIITMAMALPIKGKEIYTLATHTEPPPQGMLKIGGRAPLWIGLAMAFRSSLGLARDSLMPQKTITNPRTTKIHCCG